MNKSILNRSIGVKRWRANIGSYVIAFVLAAVLLVIAYLVETVLAMIVFALAGLLLLGLGVYRAYIARKRTLLIGELMSQGLRSEGVIVGFKSNRRYDVDMSFTSLLDGGSGISFSKYTIFIVETTTGEIYESDPTNVPEKNAEQYIASKTPVSVFVGANGNYVNVEMMPDFHFKLF